MASTGRLIRIEPPREKTCLLRFANIKRADQLAHPRSLISDFVIRFLERSICHQARRGVSGVYRVSPLYLSGDETG